MSRSSNRSFSTDSGQMTIVPVGHLDIEVVSAEDLTAADFGGKSDPYVVLVRNYSFQSFVSRFDTMIKSVQ